MRLIKLRLRGLESLNFNPRTPCGVRPREEIKKVLARIISIHAPRVGCDPFFILYTGVRKGISIHAPRVGCDPSFVSNLDTSQSISIHAPRVGCDLQAGIPLR